MAVGACGSTFSMAISLSKTTDMAWCGLFSFHCWACVIHFLACNCILILRIFAAISAWICNLHCDLITWTVFLHKRTGLAGMPEDVQADVNCNCFKYSSSAIYEVFILEVSMLSLSWVRWGFSSATSRLEYVILIAAIHVLQIQLVWLSEVIL